MSDEYLNYTQSELQELYHQGDPVALAVLFERARPTLERLALKLAMGRTTVAEDAMDRAWNRLARRTAMKSYEPEKPWTLYATKTVQRSVVDGH